MRPKWIDTTNASGVGLIADLVGHLEPSTRRAVYREQLRPVITEGTDLLDGVFGADFLKDE